MKSGTPKSEPLPGLFSRRDAEAPSSSPELSDCPLVILGSCGHVVFDSVASFCSRPTEAGSVLKLGRNHQEGKNTGRILEIKTKQTVVHYVLFG